MYLSMSNFWKTWSVFASTANKKLSKKVTKKAAKLVPTTLNTRAILPTILLGSEWPPSNIWVFMFFRLCLRSMKSCGWTRISYDLLKSLKKVNVIIPFEQVLTRKGHLILNRLQKHVSYFSSYLSLSCQGEKQANLELRMPWIGCQGKNHCLGSHLTSGFDDDLDIFFCFSFIHVILSQKTS